MNIASTLKNEKVESALRMCLLGVLILYVLIRMLSTFNVFKEVITCGAEDTTIKDDKEYFEAGGYLFDNANNRTTEMVFEGKSAIKLIPESQYGFTISLGKPGAGKKYEASVWVHEDKISSDTSGSPMLVSSIGDKFWQAATDVVDTKGPWVKLHLKITIPNETYNEPLVIYCWNSTHNSVYFDNITIERNNYWKFFRPLFGS